MPSPAINSSSAGATSSVCTLQEWRETIFEAEEHVRYKWIGPSTEAHNVPYLNPKAEPEGYLFLHTDKFPKHKDTPSIASRRLTFVIPKPVFNFYTLSEAQRTVFSNLVRWHERAVNEIKSKDSQLDSDKWGSLLRDWAIKHATSALSDKVRLVIGKPPQKGFYTDGLASSSFEKIERIAAAPQSKSEAYFTRLTAHATDPLKRFTDEDWASARAELSYLQSKGVPAPSIATERGLHHWVCKWADDHHKRLETSTQPAQGEGSSAGPYQQPPTPHSPSSTQGGTLHMSATAWQSLAENQAFMLEQGSVTDNEEE